MISTKHFSLKLFIVICSWVTLGEPTESEKQVMQSKSYIFDSFDNSNEFQMVKTHDLQEYRELHRSLTPKTSDSNEHLEQVRLFILKNGFQEPVIISCDLKTGNAYTTDGNHCLWVAHKEGIPLIPCCDNSSLVVPKMVLIQSLMLIFSL